MIALFQEILKICENYYLSFHYKYVDRPKRQSKCCSYTKQLHQGSD